jgi:hypothetical protein
MLIEYSRRERRTTGANVSVYQKELFMVYQKQTCLGLFCVQIRSTMMNRFALADITKLQIASHGLAAIAKLPLVCRPLRPHGFVDGIITWFHRHNISP